MLEVAKIPASHFDDLIDLLEIRSADYVLVSDGAANHVDQVIGWAGLLFVCRSRVVRPFYGGMNSGSIFTAEVMPVVQAVQWVASHGRWRHERRQQGVDRFHVVTDSQGLIQMIQNERSNQTIWNILPRAARSELLKLEATKLTKEDHDLAHLAHTLANRAMRSLQ